MHYNVFMRSNLIKTRSNENDNMHYNVFQDIELLGQKVMTVNLSHNLLTR